MSEKLVFFDIDGTLWDEKRWIPESTVRALKELRANGHKSFICSGRSKGNIRSKELLDLGFDGMVAACGGYVEVDGKIISNILIPHDVVRKSVELIDSGRMPSVLEGPKKHWVSDWGFEKDDFVDALFKAMGEDAVLLHDYTDDIEINKFSSDILNMTDYDRIKHELSFYYDFIEHGMTLDVIGGDASDPYAICGVIEAVPHGINKAVGIHKVCEYLGVDIKDTYGFGDSVNDLEMFEAVGHSVAMGNGTAPAKAAAEWVTDSIYEDGLYNALKHYGLI